MTDTNIVGGSREVSQVKKLGGLNFTLISETVISKVKVGRDENDRPIYEDAERKLAYYEAKSTSGVEILNFMRAAVALYMRMNGKYYDEGIYRLSSDEEIKKYKIRRLQKLDEMSVDKLRIQDLVENKPIPFHNPLTCNIEHDAISVYGDSENGYIINVTPNLIRFMVKDSELFEEIVQLASTIGAIESES